MKTKLNAYRAEYRGGIERRGRHRNQDWEEVIIVAPNFYEAAALARQFGKDHFPKLGLVTIEIESDKVVVAK